MKASFCIQVLACR